MSDEQRDAFEEHFFDCDECAERSASRRRHDSGREGGLCRDDGSGQGPDDACSSDPHVERPAWQRSVALPWAAAAALACVAAYQSLWVVPSLRQEISPRALVPVTLRPESRGAEAVVTRRSPADPVSLAVEINEPPQSGEVTYELKTSEGRSRRFGPRRRASAGNAAAAAHAVVDTERVDALHSFGPRRSGIRPPSWRVPVRGVHAMTTHPDRTHSWISHAVSFSEAMPPPSAAASSVPPTS